MNSKTDIENVGYRECNKKRYVCLNHSRSGKRYRAQNQVSNSMLNSGYDIKNRMILMF